MKTLANLALAAAVAITSAAPFAYMGVRDNHEGHAWCDGSALAVGAPVGECMKAWNVAGYHGVERWAHNTCAINPTCSADWSQADRSRVL